MRTSYFSFNHFSVNSPNHRHVDYDAAEPFTNLYHRLYFTLNVTSDTLDNTGNENDISVDSALSCIVANNSMYEPDFTATIAPNGDDEVEEYLICLELPLLRIHEQLTPDALVMSFVRFEEALYNTLSNYRNGEDYENDNDAFYTNSDNDDSENDELNAKLYVDGQKISTDDLDAFMLNIRDKLFTNGFEEDMNRISIEFLTNATDATSQNIENQILKAFIHWDMLEAARQQVKHITNSAALLSKIEKDCNFKDMNLVFKS